MFYALTRMVNGQVEVLGYDCTTNEPDYDFWENVATADSDYAWTADNMDDVADMIPYYADGYVYAIVEWDPFA